MIAVFVESRELISGAWITFEGMAFRGLIAERTLVREHFNP
jgi:hypothetical protein